MFRVADGSISSYKLYGDHNRDNHIHSQNLRMNDGENNVVVMKCLADSDSASNYGSNLLIGANGCCYIGGGESPSSLYSALGNNTSEYMYVCADSNIALAPNCNTIANRKLIWISGTQFYPETSGSHTLGTSTYKWGQIYSTASSISTSDANQKHDIAELDSTSVDFILGLSPKSYKFNDGTSNRDHWGLIAQDVEELMTELQMDSKDFAGFIKSPKEKIENEATGELVLDLDADGNAQYEYALRYEEFIAPLIKTVQEQQKQIEELRTEIESLKTIQ